MSDRKRIVVIGNGMAGARLVEELVARGGADRFRITVFGEEPRGNYNRILLSGVLAGEYAAEDIFVNPLEWYVANGVTLHAGVRAEAIDRQRRRVRGTDGIVEKYDELVLALGSRAYVPPLLGLRAGGAHKPGVFAFRTLDDCDALLAYAGGVRRAVVIGGGLLGLEAARGLLLRGLEVHVVHLREHLMETQLDAQAGAILRRTLERMGIRVHLGKKTTEVLGDARVEGVQFDDGGTLPCDLVVLSAGIQPNVDLASEAGLTVERGIVVGDDLRSPDDPHVHAVGECAQHRGQVYGLVAPLWEQAQVLADRLSGRRPDARYEGSKVATRLKVMGVDLTVMGAREVGPGDEEVAFVNAARGIYQKVVLRGGQVAGAILLGDAAAAPGVLQAFDRGLEAPENRAELLFPSIGEARPPGPLEVPPETRLCKCNGVSKGRILEALHDGHRTIDAVCRATRAGTGCGSCRRDVQRLVDAFADAPQPRARVA